MRNWLLSLLALALATSSARAQWPAPPKKPYLAIKISPLAAITSGFRGEVEYGLFKDSGQTLSIAPTLYSGRIGWLYRSNPDYRSEQVSGARLTVQHRIHSNADHRRGLGAYFFYGLEAGFVQLSYERNGYFPAVNEFGQTVLRQRWAEQKANIRRGNLQAGLGFCDNSGPRIIFDQYVGVAVNGTSIGGDKPGTDRYSKGIFNFAYKGVSIIANWSIGIRLRS